MKRGLLVLIALSFFTSCNPKIVNYLNPKASFGAFSSYSIVNVKIDKRNLAPETTKLLGTIETQIKDQMEKRRSYVSSNIAPDLILRYELVSSARTDSNSNNRSIFNPTQTLSSKVIYESIILLELFNNSSLVWQGSYDLNQSKKDSKNEKSVRKAIDLIFTTYPYRAGQIDPDLSLTEFKK